MHLLAIKLHDVVSLHFSRLHLAFAVEPMFFIAFHVGIVTQPFIVLHVLVGDHAKEALHLLLRERAVGVGLQIEQGTGIWLGFCGISGRSIRGARRLVLLTVRQCGSKK